MCQRPEGQDEGSGRSSDDARGLSKSAIQAEESTSDDASETSTLIYDHEPFETYQARVVELMRRLFPCSDASDICVSRLSGGFYNRIVGVTVSATDEYILRVPRFEAADIEVQAGVLTWLARTTSLPVAKVVVHNTLPEPPLEDPYILLRGMEGVSLHRVLDEMTHEQRLDMARRVASLIASIHEVEVPAGIGPLTLDEEGSVHVGRYKEGIFIDDGKGRAPVPPSYRAPETLLGFLRARFREQKEYAQSLGPNNEFRVEESDRLMQATEILLRDVPLRCKNVLFHREFAPRNILVTKSTPNPDPAHDSTYEISGVLDWDDCEVAPSMIACVCPGWLWGAPDEAAASGPVDENDWDPDEPVRDEGCRRIKQGFLEALEPRVPGFMDM